VERFGERAILAAARQPQHPACSWDALRILAAADLEEFAPTPAPALRALLGSMCARCEISFAAREVAERERRLLAAGHRRQRRQLAPTGVLWAASSGEPPGLTAALTRRNAAPSYYHPGRPR
jgi:hypothetical protein